jgi:hypothetical protein
MSVNNDIMTNIGLYSEILYLTRWGEYEPRPRFSQGRDFKRRRWFYIMGFNGNSNINQH